MLILLASVEHSNVRGIALKIGFENILTHPRSKDNSNIPV